MGVSEARTHVPFLEGASRACWTTRAVQRRRSHDFPTESHLPGPRHVREASPVLPFLPRHQLNVATQLAHGGRKSLLFYATKLSGRILHNGTAIR